MHDLPSISLLGSGGADPSTKLPKFKLWCKRHLTTGFFARPASRSPQRKQKAAVTTYAGRLISIGFPPEEEFFGVGCTHDAKIGEKAFMVPCETEHNATVFIPEYEMDISTSETKEIGFWCKLSKRWEFRGDNGQMRALDLFKGRHFNGKIIAL